MPSQIFLRSPKCHNSPSFLFPGAAGFLHKGKLQSAARSGEGVAEDGWRVGRGCCLKSLGVNFLELCWEQTGMSSFRGQLFSQPLCLVQRPPNTHTPFSLCWTVTTKPGTTQVPSLQRSDPRYSPRGECLTARSQHAPRQRL